MRGQEATRVHVRSVLSVDEEIRRDPPMPSLDQPSRVLVGATETLGATRRLVVGHHRRRFVSNATTSVSQLHAEVDVLETVPVPLVEAADRGHEGPRHADVAGPERAPVVPCAGGELREAEDEGVVRVGGGIVRDLVIEPVEMIPRVVRSTRFAIGS